MLKIVCVGDLQLARGQLLCEYRPDSDSASVIKIEAINTDVFLWI